MNETRQLDDLSAADIEAIDSACDRYSSSLLTDHPKSIQDLLSEVPESLRQLLLPELIELDAEHRRNHGQSVSAEFYLAQFPDWSDGLRDRISDIFCHSRTTSALPTVPGYEIDGELGRGGMGVVYRARQVSLGRTVALKLAVGRAMSRPDVLRRFQLEAESAAKLQHPNIVSIFEVGTVDGIPFYTMEFIDGPNLAQWLATTAVSARDAALLIQRLALAVARAHEAGIIHRDIKPANVMLQGYTDESGLSGSRSSGLKSTGRSEETKSGDTQNVSAKAISGGTGTSGLLNSGRPYRSPLEHAVPRLTDFGLAKQLEADTEATQTGLVMGTPGYMAPEQARGSGQDVGPAVDIYSLGAILYECLSGRPPFRASTMLETLRLVQSEEPVPPSRLQSRVPADLETICLKCLEKPPEKRYLTAVELADDLARYLSGLPITARPAGRVDLLIRWAHRKPAIAAMSAAVVVLLLALIVVPSLLAIQLNRARKNSDASAASAQASLRLANAMTSEARRERSRAVQLARESQSRLVGMRIASGVNSQQAGQTRSALLWFARAWDDDTYHSRSESHHRLRIGFARSALPELAGLCIHQSAVLEASFSRGLERVLVRDASMTATIWDPWNASIVATFEYDQPLDFAALSHDGTMVLTARGPLVQICDVSTRVIRREWKHPAAVRHAALPASGQFCVTACDDGLVRIWNLASGELQMPPLACEGEVQFVALAPDESKLIAGNSADNLQAWSFPDGKSLATNLPHATRRKAPGFMQPQFSADSLRLLTCQENELSLWDTATWQKAWSVNTRLTPQDLDMDRAGKNIVFSTGSSTGVLLRLSGPESADRLPLTNSRNTNYACLSPDAAWAAVACSGGLITVYDTNSGSIVASVRHADDLTFLRCVDGPGGENFLVSGGLDGTLRFWKIQRQPILEVPYDYSCGQAHQIGIATINGGSVFYSPDGESEVRITEHSAAIYKRRTGESQSTSIMHPEPILTGQYSADGTRCLLTGTGTAAVYDATTGKLTGPVVSLSDPIKSFDLSADGSRLLILSATFRCQVFDVASGRVLQDNNPDDAAAESRETRPVFSSAMRTGLLSSQLSPDGKLIIAKGGSDTHSVFRVEDGQRLFQTDPQKGVAAPIAFSGDSQRFLVVNSDMRARVWDLREHVPAGPFLTHTTFARSGCLNSDGTLAATLCSDQQLRIWSARTGDLLHTSQFAPQNHIWFSSDSASLNVRKTSGELTKLMFHPIPGSKEQCRSFTELLCCEYIDETEGISVVPADCYRSRPAHFLSVWREVRRDSETQRR